MVETWTTEKIRIWQFAMKSMDLPPAPDALASLIQSHVDVNLQLRDFAQAVADKQTECKMQSDCDTRQPGLPYCLPCWSREILAGEVADSRTCECGGLKLDPSGKTHKSWCNDGPRRR